MVIRNNATANTKSVMSVLDETILFSFELKEPLRCSHSTSLYFQCYEFFTLESPHKGIIISTIMTL